MMMNVVCCMDLYKLLHERANGGTDVRLAILMRGLSSASQTLFDFTFWEANKYIMPCLIPLSCQKWSTRHMVKRKA